MDTHLKLYATQLKQLTHTQTHPLHCFNADSDLPRNMKATIFHNNEHNNIIISKLNITSEECRENFKHSLLPSPLNISVPEKTTKLLTPHFMTIIHWNEHYHLTCIKNWHNSKPTNHHSCKVTYIQ